MPDDYTVKSSGTNDQVWPAILTLISLLTCDRATTTVLATTVTVPATQTPTTTPTRKFYSKPKSFSWLTYTEMALTTTPTPMGALTTMMGRVTRPTPLLVATDTLPALVIVEAPARSRHWDEWWRMKDLERTRGVTWKICRHEMVRGSGAGESIDPRPNQVHVHSARCPT
jgi:hypothetical protein